MDRPVGEAGPEPRRSPNLKRWFHAIAERPATKAAYDHAPKVNPDFGKTMSEDAKKVMFGQNAANTKR